jgi:hypothetical protein
MTFLENISNIISPGGEEGNFYHRFLVLSPVSELGIYTCQIDDYDISKDTLDLQLIFVVLKNNVLHI